MSTEQVVERPVETCTDVAALLAGLVTVAVWGSAFVAVREQDSRDCHDSCERQRSDPAR